MKERSFCFILGIVFVLLIGGICIASVYDVTDYGATGDGNTLDTDAINLAVAAADANGGGTVYFPAGTYKSGSIIMKDNITLDLDANAILLATDTNDYLLVDDNPWDAYQDWGHSHWKSSLIWGTGVENIAITGSGLINGSAMTTGDPADYYGDRAISFKLCTGILIKDITIYKGGHFGIITIGCNDVTIDNVTIDTNRDGMNIDCCNDVNIVNCTVNSPSDDGICLKSCYGLGYKRPTENVTISKCTVMGRAVGYLLPQFPNGSSGGNFGRIKFGTESNGGFKNITITDCNFEHCRGFMLATVDGGDIENIYIDNIQMTELVTPPIFIRLGNRARGPGPPPPGTYRNLNMSNITAESDHQGLSSIISGIPGHYVEDVNFSNITLNYPGGGSSADANAVLSENETGYPGTFMFGTVSPSYGFYIRHAKNVEFHDSQFDFVNDDKRPAFALIDANGIEIDNTDAERFSGNESFIKFDDVDNLNIHDCNDFPLVTATYDILDTSPNKVNLGEVFTLFAPAQASSDGVCTTDLLVDSNYFDTEYIWLNGGVQKNVEFADIQLYETGYHLMEVAAQDLTVYVCLLSDFDFSGNIDFEDYNVLADNWLEQTGTAALPNDPIAWWKFEEGSGSYAYDSSGNNNTGTLHNMDSNDWVSGYDGKALDFDDSDDYIEVPNSPSISVGASDYTLCAWIYPRSISGDRGIMAKVKNGSDKEYAFSLGNDNATDGALVLDVEWSSNNGAEYTDAVVTTNEWQHVIVVFDSATTEAYFYHNFESVPVVFDNIVRLPRYFDDDLWIGRWGGSYNKKEFDGIIDDVRIYNYKLQPLQRSPEDLNKDYIVNFKDHAIFAEDWLADID